MERKYAVAFSGDGFKGVLTISAEDAENAIEKARNIHWYDPKTKIEFVNFASEDDLTKFVSFEQEDD